MTTLSITEELFVLKEIIQKYELALQAYENALVEAEIGENCGFGGSFLTQQEFSKQRAEESATKVRALVKITSIKLPQLPEIPFENIRRGERLLGECTSGDDEDE